MFRSSQHTILRGVFARIRNCQVRTIRTRGGTNIYTDALRRDERLLKRLEAQLANVQAKIKRDEAEALEFMKQRPGTGPNDELEVDDHGFYFWEKVLTAEDRKDLASHGINSLDELYTVYQAAEDTMTKPPYPKLELLEPRSRFAYQMYQSIPERISNDAHAKAKSPLRSWF